jgi:hypothetical protein
MYVASFQPSTDVLRGTFALRWTEVAPQGSSKQLQEHLPADSRNGWIVSTFAQLVPNESMLCVGRLVEAEGDSSFM